jgi:CubicO group peptidase (beta-lactamase class C family)
VTVTVPTGPILQQRLSDALARHGVPGAVIGLLAGGAITVRSGGLTRTPGGAPITADTLFLIASVTKVWTATMVLQLVDEGSVELDAPVNRYLDPPLRLAEPDVADAVTVGQLLTHSGGFFGDAEEPPDADDDAVAQTVAGYATLTQLHRPGTMFSYSNAGYNVLGRLVECLTNQNWDDALETRLVRPLGLTHTFTRLVRAATHPLAVGHEPRGSHDRTLAPVETW